MTEAASGAPPSPFASPEDWLAAWRWGAEQMARLAPRRIVLADPDFGDWPLDEDLQLQRWQAHLRLPGRSLVLLAARLDQIALRHPRFARWRVDWMHAIHVYTAPEDLADQVPSLLLGGEIGVERLGREAGRGRAWRDARQSHLAGLALDALSQRCAGGWPVRTAGL